MTSLKVSRKDLTDDEKRHLIQSVQKYPVIWDRGNTEFKTGHFKHRRQMAWQEISTQLFHDSYDVEFLKAKWEGLRKVFLQEQKKLMDRVSQRNDAQEIDYADVTVLKWKFFKDMTFLNESVFGNPLELEPTQFPNRSSFASKDDDAYMGSVSHLVTTNGSDRKRSGDFLEMIANNSTQLNQILRSASNNAHDANCDIKKWLASLAMHFYELPEYKLEIQTEIMGVLLKYKKLKDNNKMTQ